ncbi:hypothetical protein U4E84_13255 [Halorubrum sp. AD140]|uniref:hypothetical protein n=1 Tax=Halorubrum sp. AD140 TaxID=3050073 RepID=UPI002ACCD27F|nr:hypothetical protein [Halorubrum sp. AD140]MDZ5812310.1 hypothetical protein [Halorubrum sp. AD140]
MAVYVALFVLIAGGAGVLTATAESPEIGFENPDFEVSENDTVEVDGESYTVAGISEGEDGMMGTLEQEETVERSETWENESTIELDDREWRVEITGDEPSEFTLVEVLDREAILEEDDSADNETIERDDGEYVAVTEDNETTLVPVDEYFPAPEEQSYATGDSLEYDDRTVTVDEITADQAVVVWEGTQTNTVEIEEETPVTIGETEFVATFPDDSTMALSSDIEGYEAQVAEIDQFDQYTDGLTRVVVLAFLSVLLLLAAAFVPTRY